MRRGEDVLFDMIREVGQYDLSSYSGAGLRVLWDARVGDFGVDAFATQLGVSMMFNAEKLDRDRMRAMVAEHRAIAAELLRKRMIENSLRFSDLRPLEFPPGHINPWDR